MLFVFHDETDLIFGHSLGVSQRPLSLEPFIEERVYQKQRFPFKKFDEDFPPIIPASKSMGSYYRFAISLYSHFGVEITHDYALVGLSSKKEGPRYVNKIDMSYPLLHRPSGLARRVHL